MLGHPFGLSYEIVEKKALKTVAQKSIEDIGVLVCKTGNSII